MTIDEIKQKTTPIFEQYGIAYAALFGSAARGESNSQSDIDLLVRFGRPVGMVGYMQLIESLEDHLQKRVDVVTEHSLNKYVRPYVLPDLKILYEK